MTTTRWLPPPHPGGPVVITPRMADVLTCLHRGLSNKEIGRELFISYHTVRTHVRRLMVDSGAHSLAHLVAITAHRPVQVRGRWAR